MTIVSICIVTHNSATIDHCITSVQAATKGIPAEVLVVDNASTQAYKQHLQTLRTVILIQNTHNVGFGRANNQAIERAQGTFILILNPDVILQTNTIRELVTHLMRNPSVVIAAPQLLNDDGSIQHSCRRFPTLLVSLARRLHLQASLQSRMQSYEMQDLTHQTPTKVDWASGACLLLRGKQYFDPRYFLYFEDVDLCRTAQEVHYVPSAKATHLGSYASRTLSKALLHHTASMIKYYGKWGIRKS